MADCLLLGQLSLENDDILIALESPGEPVTVTFKDDMLRTQVAESNDLALVEDLLCSYADGKGPDFENLIFGVNGERELGQADYSSTLRDVSFTCIQSRDLIA